MSQVGESAFRDQMWGDRSLYSLVQVFLHERQPEGCSVREVSAFSVSVPLFRAQEISPRSAFERPSAGF